MTSHQLQEFPLSSRGSRLESANTNEINCDIHLAFTLFKLEYSRYLLVLFSFKVLEQMNTVLKYVIGSDLLNCHENFVP